MAKKPKRRPKFWKLLPPEDKKGVVRSLLEAGYTRAAIGKALGTTKNAIVGFQHRKLPKLTGKPEGTLDSVPDDVLRKLVSIEWPIEEAAEPDPEPQPEPPPAPPHPAPTRRARRRAAEEAEHEEIAEEPTAEPMPRGPVYQLEGRVVGDEQRTSSDRIRPKVAVSEALQCTHRGDDKFRCGYEWTDAVSKKCDLHK